MAQIDFVDGSGKEVQGRSDRGDSAADPGDPLERM
jgi:hypothetical protein